MTNFKDILVATDFGVASRHAADIACDIAAKFEGRLTLLHVWTVPIPSYVDTSIAFPLEHIEAAAVSTLAAEAERIRAKHPAVRTLLFPGLAWRAILEAIEEYKFDLIVLGTHGRHGAQRLFLGSVAEKVVRASLIPVLTVHAPPSASTETGTEKKTGAP